ncbi:hypothetical protein BJ912DRAFT_1115024 [Pholiota molesta]|nr:hypothetical protein BJ912DRAFT_1115024 [Pholiota molesta]
MLGPWRMGCSRRISQESCGHSAATHLEGWAIQPFADSEIPPTASRLAVCFIRGDGVAAGRAICVPALFFSFRGSRKMRRTCAVLTKALRGIELLRDCLLVHILQQFAFITVAFVMYILVVVVFVVVAFVVRRRSLRIVLLCVLPLPYPSHESRRSQDTQRRLTTSQRTKAPEPSRRRREQFRRRMPVYPKTKARWSRTADGIALMSDADPAARLMHELGGQAVDVQREIVGDRDSDNRVERDAGEMRASKRASEWRRWRVEKVAIETYHFSSPVTPKQLRRAPNEKQQFPKVVPATPNDT